MAPPEDSEIPPLPVESVTPLPVADTIAEIVEAVELLPVNDVVPLEVRLFDIAKDAPVNDSAPPNVSALLVVILPALLTVRLFTFVMDPSATAVEPLLSVTLYVFPDVEPATASAPAALVPVRFALDVVEDVASFKLTLREPAVITPLPFSAIEYAVPDPSALAVVNVTAFAPAFTAALIAKAVPAVVDVVDSAALPEVEILLLIVIVEPVRLRAAVETVPAVVIAPASLTVKFPAVVEAFS